MSKQHSVTSVLYDKRGRVLSIGRNSYTETHTLQARYAKNVGLRLLNIHRGEDMLDERCIECNAKDNLIEVGGQFCGGTWYLCGGCYLEREGNHRKLTEIVEKFCKEKRDEKGT